VRSTKNKQGGKYIMKQFIVIITAFFLSIVANAQKTSGNISINLQKQTNEVVPSLPEYKNWLKNKTMPKSIAGNVESSDPKGIEAGHIAHISALATTLSGIPEIGKTVTTANVVSVMDELGGSVYMQDIDFDNLSGNVLALSWQGNTWGGGKWVPITLNGVHKCIVHGAENGNIYILGLGSCFNNGGKSIINAIQNGTAKIVDAGIGSNDDEEEDEETEVDASTSTLTPEEKKELEDLIAKTVSANGGNTSGSPIIVNLAIAKNGNVSAKANAKGGSVGNVGCCNGSSGSGDSGFGQVQPGVGGGIGTPGKTRQVITSQTTTMTPMDGYGVGSGTTNVTSTDGVNSSISNAQFEMILSEMKSMKRGLRFDRFMQLLNTGLNVHQSVRLEQFWRSHLNGVGGIWKGGRFISNGTGTNTGGGGFMSNGTGGG